MEPTVEFGELPAGGPRRDNDNHRRGEGKWGSIAAQLRERPGQWARVDTTDRAQLAYNRANIIRRGHYLSMPPGDFESAVRTNGDRHDVWMRYVGGPS